jgi:glucose dehydrogenase
MFFRQFPTQDASLSYLFGCAGYGKAVAVDVVAGDEQWFVDQAAQQKVKITQSSIRTYMPITCQAAGSWRGGSRRRTACTNRRHRQCVLPSCRCAMGR